MPPQGEHQQSAFEAVDDQVALYEATDGREGGELQGEPCKASPRKLTSARRVWHSEPYGTAHRVRVAGQS
jgi:hypothetical protein